MMPLPYKNRPSEGDGIGRRSCRSFRKQLIAPGLTMLAMNSQIAIYEEMSALSARMVKAAQANDWDDLLRLEKSVMALRRSLVPDDSLQLTAEEVVAKHALIQRILDDDAEIRRHTEPWMERIRHFLGKDYRRTHPEGACGASS